MARSVSRGEVTLDAGASDSGGWPRSRTIRWWIAGRHSSPRGLNRPDGWFTYRDTTTVPYGTYTLQSDAYDAAGNQRVSSVISVTVAN